MRYKLKLIRGCSYTGYGIQATAQNPFVRVAVKKVADYLVDCKRFELIEATDEENPDDETQNISLDDQMSNTTSESDPSEQWTTRQLRAYASENGIDISGVTAKADILAKIQEAVSAIDYSANV